MNFWLYAGLTEGYRVCEGLHWRDVRKNGVEHACTCNVPNNWYPRIGASNEPGILNCVFSNNIFFFGQPIMCLLDLISCLNYYDCSILLQNVSQLKLSQSPMDLLLLLTISSPDWLIIKIDLVRNKGFFQSRCFT